MMRTMIVHAVAALAVAALAGSAAANVPPTPFLKSELPANLRYATPKVTLSKPERALGVVNVEAGDGAIVYAVYPTKAAAAKRLAEWKSGDGFKLLGRVPGYGAQSKMLVGSMTGENVFGKKVTNGVTYLIVVRGPVLVLSMSTSTTSIASGDLTDARALLSSGVRHLARVQA